jgi:hypothetical protein
VKRTRKNVIPNSQYHIENRSGVPTAARDIQSYRSSGIFFKIFEEVKWLLAGQSGREV